MLNRCQILFLQIFDRAKKAYSAGNLQNKMWTFYFDNNETFKFYFQKKKTFSLKKKATPLTKLFWLRKN